MKRDLLEGKVLAKLAFCRIEFPAFLFPRAYIDIQKQRRAESRSDLRSVRPFS